MILHNEIENTFLSFFVQVKASVTSTEIFQKM